MTDVRLEDCGAIGEGWDDWVAAPRSVDRAEAVERATSSRIFFVRAVARALLAVDAGLLPTRRRAQRAGRGVLRLAALLATPVTLPLRGLARCVSTAPKSTGPEAAGPEAAGPEATGPVLPEAAVPRTVVPETVHLDTVAPEVALRQPETISRHVTEALAPAPSVSPARRSDRFDGPPLPVLLDRLACRARVLGTRSTATAVLADLTWPARALVPRHPATSAVAALRRLPDLVAEARRAPSMLLKVALASSMTITILGSSAAAAIHTGGAAGGVSGQVRSALPGTSTTGAAGARPEAAGKGATGHSALASSAPGGPASGTLPPTTVPAPAGPPVVPTVRAGLPPGKGMWIYVPEKVEGGNVTAIVSKATATGLHYLYVHLGSGTDGFIGQAFLNQLLPAAHAAHIRVYGWDFPFFTPPENDVNRAVAEINYKTPSGDRIDGFAPDIEAEPGVNLAGAGTYAGELRNAVGPGYPIIGVVPRPNGSGYPYSAVLSHFNAVAVMDYWLDAEPGADIARADANLAGQNLAMIPIGQAYNGAENGVPGSPSGAAISRFLQVAEQTGAVGVSFWSWQDTTPEEWDAIRTAPQFSLPTAPAPMTPGQIRTWQVLLTSLGFPAWPTGVWDQSSVTAVSNYQRAANLPVTGVVDDATKAIMLTPFPPPIQPPQPPAPAPAPTTTAPTTTVPPNAHQLLPFLSASQGMGTPTSAPISH